MWDKEKMLVTSIFSLSHNVFKSLLSSRSLKVWIVWSRCKVFMNLLTPITTTNGSHYPLPLKLIRQSKAPSPFCEDGHNPLHQLVEAVKNPFAISQRRILSPSSNSTGGQMPFGENAEALNFLGRQKSLYHRRTISPLIGDHPFTDLSW